MPFVVPWLCGAAGRVLRSLCDTLPAARGGSVWGGVVSCSALVVSFRLWAFCVPSVGVVSPAVGVVSSAVFSALSAACGGSMAGVVSVSSV